MSWRNRLPLQAPASLPAAFDGVTASYIITPHDPSAGFGSDADLTAALVNAAVASGVKHIAFGGSWTVNYPEALPSLSARFLPTEVHTRAHMHMSNMHMSYVVVVSGGNRRRVDGL